MPPRRPALTLLAAIALVSPAVSASAATSRLTPNPPVTLTQPGTTDAGAGTPTSTTIPRTGTDLPEELLIAGGLIAAGAMLRARRPSGRR